MTMNSPAMAKTDAASLVDNAVEAYATGLKMRPDGSTLTAALLRLEKDVKQNCLMISQDSLLGTWRLCFSAGKKSKYQSGQPVGSGFYIPEWAIARITFAPNPSPEATLAIANELHVGPLKIRFTGPARYPGTKNLLAFDFTEIAVTCFGVSVYRGSVGEKKRAGKPFSERKISQLPFFSFFAATDQYIAARGRGGGLAIWSKTED